MKVIGIIPARYGSTRFPGKPLADIAGKSMIQRVVEQAQKAKRLHDVVVATDDQRIADHVHHFGGKVVLTDANHPSGTDRCREALNHFEDVEVVINIQGDEPLIPPSQIDALIECFEEAETQIATLIKPISSTAILTDPNKPKVLVNHHGEAIYFSRTPLPYVKGQAIENWLNHHPYWQHIGVYAYRANTLKAITLLAPSPLENAESLEQLRWIEHGYRIRVATTDHESFPVDTPEDLERLLTYLKASEKQTEP